MILQRSFRVPVEEALYPRAIQILQNEFGLVDGHMHPKDGDERCLVWEDEKGIGRWRVHCYGNSEHEGERYDDFIFHYWTHPNRLRKSVLERDPMGPAINRVYREAKNPIEIGHMFVDLEMDKCFQTPL